MKDKVVRTRFAPSPTGYLHIGGLRTALYGYLFAQKNKGQFILRLEDTDQNRYVEGAAELIYKTLKSTGITYSEGPDVGGKYGPYVQSERKDIYKKHAEELVGRGAAYYCFCSKERLASLPKQGEESQRYDGHCRELSKADVAKRLKAGEPYVIRQKMPTEGVSRYDDLVFGEIAVENKELEDNILLKSDGMPTYNFANVVDDRLMGITHVMRGTEYLSSTPKYNLIYEGFGWPVPQYIHMQPIMKDAHQKLSKRHGDASYGDFIGKGYLKEAIVNYIALLGWSPGDNTEKMSMAEMIEKFSLAGLSKSPSIFDEAKMRWLNGEYIKEMPDNEFFSAVTPFLQKSKINGKFSLEKAAALLKPRIEIFSEAETALDYLAEYSDFPATLYEHQKMKTNADTAKTVLPAVLAVLEKVPEPKWNTAALHDALMTLPPALSLKNGQVLYPARIALTARETTHGGAAENADILGKSESLKRLKRSIERLK